MVQRHQHGLTAPERRLIGRLLLLLAFVVLIWFIFAPNRGVVHYYRLQKQIEALARENRGLEERNNELRKEIERLQNDDTYLEELAREKYNLLRENETVYTFKPSGDKE